MNSLLPLAKFAAVLAALFAAPLALAAGADAGAGAGALPPAPWDHLHSLGLGVIVCVNALFLLALIFVALSLRGDTSWSLGGALSESTDWVAPTPPPPTSGFTAAPASAEKDPSATPRHEASSSRLIAFIGMLAIIFVFLGIADWVIWKCFTEKEVPKDVSGLLAFLCGGASLFVPYGINQFRSAFETFTKPASR